MSNGAASARPSETLEIPDSKVPENPITEEDVQYINAKQFHRILKRRMARQQLADTLEEQRRAQHRDVATSEHATASPDLSDSIHPTEADDATPLPIVQILEHYEPIDTSAELDTDNQVELSWSYPALSAAQTSRLWWQAYISFTSSSTSTSPIFTTISNALKSELGAVASNYVLDEMICKRVAIRVANLQAAIYDKPELTNVLEIRTNILTVLITIEEQLGFEIATLGWSCVIVLLCVS